MTERRKPYARPRAVDSQPVPIGVTVKDVMTEYMAAAKEAEIEVSEAELRLYEQTMSEAVQSQLEQETTES